MEKRKNKTAMPDIQDTSTFQGKYDALQSSFFPANVVTPPPLPEGFLPPETKDLSNTFHAVSAATIARILRKSRTDLATGPDLISYRMIRCLTETHPQVLADLFTNLLRQAAFPDNWKITKCVPIPKPGKTDLRSPKSLRPISLLSCLGKLFEKILAKRIAEAAEITGALSSREFGCRKSRSAIDALMVTLTTAQELLRHNSTYMRKVERPSIMTNDIEGAFHCVLHPTLIGILRHNGFPRSLVETIANFNTNQRIYLEFDGAKKTPVAFDAGLPQGSPLSPILFVIYGAAIEQYKAN